MQLQEVSLDVTLGRVVGRQRDVCRDEVEVDRARLQPDGAAQQGRLPLTRLLLLDVLPYVDVLHHGADALPHRLVVQVAGGNPDCSRLEKQESE